MRFQTIAFTLAIIVAVMIVFSSKNLVFCQQPAKDNKSIVIFEQTKTIIADIKGEEIHSYEVNLSTNQLLNLVIEQQGVVLDVTLYDPANNKLLNLNVWQHYVGRIPLYWVAQESGNYKIKVLSANKDAAAGKYQIKIVELKPSINEDKDKVLAQNNLVQAYELRLQESKESKLKAVERFLEAEPKYKALGDKYGQAYTLELIGATYTSLGEFQRAIDYYNQAILLSKTVNELATEARANFNMGYTLNYLGKSTEAHNVLKQALEICKQIGDRAGEAEALNNTGQVYGSQGEFRKAYDCFNWILPLYKELGDYSGEAEVFNNIGQAYYSLGEMQKALDSFLKSLELCKQIGDRSRATQALNNTGITYDVLGQKQKALDYYNQSLQLCRELGNYAGEAYTLNNIGTLYKSLGERQKALDYLNQSLLLRKKVGDRSGEARTLGNIGSLYNASGEKQKAIEYLNQSLTLYKQIGNSAGEASTLSIIGQAYDFLGDKEKALDYYNQSLTLRRKVGDRAGEALTLNNIGQVYYSLGEKQKALEYHNQAMTLNEQVGDRSLQANILFNVARLESEQNNLAAAQLNIEKSINLVEFIRTGVVGQQLRSSFFASIHDYYELYENILMKQHKADSKAGFDSLALQVSEKSRARGLVELLTEAKINIREGVDRKLLEQENNLLQLINDKNELLLKLKSKKNNAEKAAQLEKEIDTIISEYKIVGDKIRATSPKYAALTQPKPLSLKEVQQLLDEDTILLEYSLGDKTSYLWLVSKTLLKSFELPGKKQLEDKAKSFYNLISTNSNPQQDLSYQQVASELGQMLLGSVEGELGKKRLLIISEGALQYIPFAALSLSSNSYAPLILEHEIVNLPSASALALQRNEFTSRESAKKLLALLADPVFEQDDPRIKQSIAQRKSKQTKIVSQRGSSEDKDKIANELELASLLRSAEDTGITRQAGGFSRLPGSRKEANQISEFVEKDLLFKALDFDASLTTVTSTELSQYKYVHFATHGLVNSTNPELSGIVLTLFDKDGKAQRGFLSLTDIYNLRINAELVVLSACQTGLGKEVKGEGLIGLARGFMYAGSKSLVTSLWKVDDLATADLLTTFYQSMIKEGKKPAQALRLAQISLLKKKLSSNPFYWAGFTFQGDYF